MEKLCPHCQYPINPKKKKRKKEMYDSSKFKNFTEFMDDCLRRSSERMRKEMGYGIPETEQE